MHTYVNHGRHGILSLGTVTKCFFNVCPTLKYIKCHEFPDSESITVQLFILKRSNHILHAHLYSVVIFS